MLNVERLNSYYGELHILRDVSLRVEQREIVSVIGANGAGKSTLINCIGGLIQSKSGSILFRDQVINQVPAHEIVRAGLVQVPGERLLFSRMTVLENLLLGAWIHRDRAKKEEKLNRVLELFPILRERQRQKAGSLSGGEQQMLAIARGLMAGPSMLMLDEPSFGLAPKIVLELFDVVKEVRKGGLSVLLVEQDVVQSLSIADRGYVLENGRITLENTAEALCRDDHVKKAYIGI